MLNQDQKRRYLKKKGTVCPYCGSRTLQRGTFRYEEIDISQSVTCLDCNKSWENVYRLGEIVER
jgi:DNA-directed RNA polymerase subunit RPC12/RpoP